MIVRLRNAVGPVWTFASLSWKADRRRTAAALVMVVLNAATSSLNALWLKLTIDGVSTHRSGLALTGAVAMGSGVLMYGLFGFAAQMIRTPLRAKVLFAVRQHLLEASLALPGIEHFERGEYLDKLTLLQGQLPQMTESFWSAADVVGVLVQFVITCVLLATVQPVLLFVPVFSLPFVVNAARSQRRMGRVNDSLAGDIRLEDHLMRLATTAPPAKEIRVFRLERWLAWRRDAVQQDIVRRRLRALHRLQLSGTGTSMVFTLAALGAVIFVAARAAAGVSSAGDVVMTFEASMRVTGQLAGLIGVGATLEGLTRGLANYRWFTAHAAQQMERIETPGTLPASLQHGIDLDAVSFTYPGTEHEVLIDIDLHLRPGSVVALVGENGAGKSTLIKLLCRFYNPSQGVVTVDGVDLKTIPADEWRQAMTASFQDFMRFEFQARETIGVGRLGADDPSILDSLMRADGADVLAALPSGLDTQVGKSFAGGMDLSGGQWQKIAIGRSLLRPEPLLTVLDEPTAALDAIAESRLFERYAQQARANADGNGGITLFVSHRFSTVSMADHIVVMESGRVTEQGSHTQLVAAGGLYAELYEMQAKSYR